MYICLNKFCLFRGVRVRGVCGVSALVGGWYSLIGIGEADAQQALAKQVRQKKQPSD